MTRPQRLWVHPQPNGHLDVDELLGDLAPEIEQWNYQNLVFVGKSVLRNNLNWKLANDTFGETYHFPRLHKDTLAKLFYGDALHYTEFDRNHRFVWATKGIDALSNLPEDAWDYESATGMLYFLFPNIQLTAGRDNCSVIKIYPDGENPGKSVTRVGHYFSQEAIDHSKQAEKVIGSEDAYEYDARQDGVGFFS